MKTREEIKYVVEAQLINVEDKTELIEIVADRYAVKFAKYVTDGKVNRFLNTPKQILENFKKEIESL